MKDEVQNLRSELLTWVKQWQDLKVKKDRLKTMKRSWITANRKFLKRDEQHRIENIKLKAKLSEAYRVIKLRSAPRKLLLLLSFFLFLFGNKRTGN